MILIDALYINNSGGKTLLDYLVDELEKSNLDVFYLFDSRCEGEYSEVPHERKLFLKANLQNRYLFYKKNKKRFTKVFCFGNIPPLQKSDFPTYVYFHQVLYLSAPLDTPLKKRILLWLKSFVIKLIKKNATYWLVQSNEVASGLAKKFNIPKKQINIIPFYPPLSGITQEIRNPHSYLYVSNGNPHKNHLRLINAFKKFAKDQEKQVALHLTVSDAYPGLCNIIEHAKESGIKITNHGLVIRAKLGELYKEATYLIYPSVRESFGLGLVEGIESGCKIIGADLPYTYAVCSPSLTFNPFSEESILQALIESTKPPIRDSELKVSNKIDNLIELLK